MLYSEKSRTFALIMTENTILDERLVVLVAEEAEEKMVRQFLPDVECIRMGVGAGNVIKTCSQLPHGTRVFNIGYAGSNQLGIGTVTQVSETYRLVLGSYDFTDHNSPLAISNEGYPCYTNNDFVTESCLTSPALFDMELNYIAAFPLQLVGAIKVVSDNLSIDAFRNNALRESGLLTAAEVWQQVADLFHKCVNS